MSRRVVIALASALVLIVAGLIVFVSLLASSRVNGFASPGSPFPPGQSRALLNFTGYTNALFRPRRRRLSTPETFATFRLTNATAERFTYYAESIETWTSVGWQATTLRCTPTNWYRFGTTLEPGESVAFDVPQPASAPWRIRLTCREKAKGVQGIRDRFADYRANPRVGEGTRRETFSGFTYQIVSPEVKP
jgi:hypothetical protein